MNTQDTIELLQQAINQITLERNSALERATRAKDILTHIAHHIDEYSKPRICGELIAIAEEVL